MPPAEWSYAARSKISRGEVAAVLKLRQAVRDGTLPAAELVDLFARVHHAAPRPAPPPLEPAIWTGPERYSYGSPKLDAEKAAEIRELRRQGWSTGKLARRFGVTRSTICNVLLRRTSYLPPCPAPPLIVLSSDEKSRISAEKPGLIVTAPWREVGADL
jgi:hypothetical protein